MNGATICWPTSVIGTAGTASRCRSCGSILRHVMADLGMSPLANSYLTVDQVRQMEPFYPLRVRVCEDCFLAQAEDFEAPDHIFSNYAYFSSFSDTWLQHARTYAEMATERFGLGPKSQVVEIASNDGYLLQYFQALGISVLGIEPAANVAEVAIQKKIPTLVKFFGEKTAKELVAQGNQADLVIGNNVLAHVQDLNDFVRGLRIALCSGGVLTVEFPHLMRLLAENQFDTIYHEHYSYLSLLAVERVFGSHGLDVFDVEEVSTHGGSLRIFACPSGERSSVNRVNDMRRREREAGLDNIETYSGFSEKIKDTKRSLLEFLISVKRQKKSVVCYGAPAKGNTLLNYCGVGLDFIDYTVDRSPHKQGHFLPGTHIPIYAPERIKETHPDFLLVLPWNLISEIQEQMAHIREWGGKFVTPIPTTRILA